MDIELRNVSKGYDKTVLDGLDLHIKGHNAVAIIGKSGCGKSTLLRLMTGIEFPDEGFIKINNHVVDESTIKEFQKKIGIVFQQHNLFPHLSILKNITLILEKRKGYTKTEAREKATSLLNMLHLKDEMSKKSSFISGGQAQRASIARALSTDPEMIFLDEPTAALDPILTSEVLDAILTLKKQGIKFVFVTHEISFVKKFADYVVFMDEGKVVEEGHVQILENPKTELLKNFMSQVI